MVKLVPETTMAHSMGNLLPDTLLLQCQAHISSEELLMISLLPILPPTMDLFNLQLLPLSILIPIKTSITSMFIIILLLKHQLILLLGRAITYRHTTSTMLVLGHSEFQFKFQILIRLSFGRLMQCKNLPLTTTTILRS